MKFIYTNNPNARKKLLSQGLKELKEVKLCGVDTYCFSYEDNMELNLNFSSGKDIVFSDTLFL